VARSGIGALDVRQASADHAREALSYNSLALYLGIAFGPALGEWLLRDGTSTRRGSGRLCWVQWPHCLLPGFRVCGTPGRPQSLPRSCPADGYPYGRCSAAPPGWA
jgi:hypothetical protein